MAKANVAPIATLRVWRSLECVCLGETTQERSDALNASRSYQAGDGAGADRPAEPLVEGVVLGVQSVALPG